MRVFRWLWPYIRPYRFTILLGLLFLAVLDTIFITWPYFTGGIVDQVIHGGYQRLGYPDRMSLLTLYLLGMFGVIILKSISRYTYHISMEKASVSILADIKNDLYAHMQKLDFRFFDNNRTGDVMTRMSSDMEMIRHFIAWILPMTLENTFIFAGAILILMLNQPILTLALLAVTPLIALLAFRLSRLVKPIYLAIREAYSSLNTVVQENISGNRVVKAFARESHEMGKLTEVNENYRNESLKASRVWAKFLPQLDVLSGAMTIIIVILGGWMVIQGKITVGQLVVFNGLIWMISNPMRVLGNIVNDTQRFFASTEKVLWLVDAESGIGENSRVRPEETGQDPVSVRGEVEFVHVNFKYRGEPVLSDISFKVSPGEQVCIMGPTGSGKSTLVSLIGRYHDCSSGQVLVDGRDVRKYDLRRLRSAVSMAMQDVFLFSDTIEGNITYSMPDAPDDEVKEAAEVAKADEFICRMEEGYDTIIGERGVGLSGGQRQRVALARALIRQSPILILDDTTSSLDIETEYSIHAAMQRRYADRTTFMITHRVSQASRADRIIVMMDGRIAEMGNHCSLLARKGYYYEIFRQQYDDYDEIMEILGSEGEGETAHGQKQV
ncbi:MAG TPA: ABC transporter ATP-binding protein [Clostridiales bacterium]|nr:ABC transporter ATP-binding protein [Clostridiales bacterium]